MDRSTFRLTTRFSPGFASHVAILAAALSAGCRAPEHPSRESEARLTAEQLIAIDGFREVPIRFVLMERPCEGDACRPCSDGKAMCGPDIVSLRDLRGRVREANLVFAAAGIHFHIDRVDRYAMPHFFDVTSSNELPWKDVRAELRGTFTFDDSLFGDDDAWSPVVWIAHMSARTSPPSEVLVTVAESASQAWGFYPQEGRVIIETPYNLSPVTWNFSHELGHFFGLPHTFGAPWNTMQWDLKPGYLINPATQRGIVLSDFHDLVYAPGSPPTFYPDRDSASAVEGSLRTIEGTDPAHACESNVRCCAKQCRVSCSLDGTVLGHGDAGMSGVAITVTDGHPPTTSYGPNVMSYMAAGPDLGCRVGLSPSQILQIRRSLHWDVLNTSFPGLLGGRPFLGRDPSTSVPLPTR